MASVLSFQVDLMVFVVFWSACLPFPYFGRLHYTHFLCIRGSHPIAIQYLGQTSGYSLPILFYPL